jgi:hypothetical protein
MTATLGPIRYRPGFEPVAIQIITPFGTITLQTVQATLTARADGGTWGDTEAKALAQDFLTDLYPDAGFVVA